MVQLTLDLATLSPTDAHHLANFILAYSAKQEALTPEAAGSRMAELFPATSIPAPVVVEAVAPTPKKRSAREKTTMSEHRVAEATAPSAAPTVEEKPTAPRSVGELRAALQTYTEKHGMALGIDLLKDFGCSRITEMAALDPKLQEEFVGLANG